MKETGQEGESDTQQAEFTLRYLMGLQPTCYSNLAVLYQKQIKTTQENVT